MGQKKRIGMGWDMIGIGWDWIGLDGMGGDRMSID